MLNGIVGEAALAAPLAQWLESLAVPPPYSTYGATGLVVVLITYFSIVAGELVPKRIGQTHPETLARLVARPINWLAIGTKPFVHLLSASTRACCAFSVSRKERQRGDRRGDPRHAG